MTTTRQIEAALAAFHAHMRGDIHAPYDKAMAAALAAAEAAAWEPIESAPKDGRAILVSQNGVCAIAGWSRLGGYWQILPCSPSGEVNPINPDHWRSLPSPPGREGTP